jgi:hypothetical protein
MIRRRMAAAISSTRALVSPFDPLVSVSVAVGIGSWLLGGTHGAATFTVSN